MSLLSGVTVERVIACPPGPIFDLLADPSRHREIDGSGTVREASSGSVRLSCGARFGMDMRAGGSYKMVNEVVEFETDRLIAWQPRPALRAARKILGGRIWRYELEPVEGGTRVRETWDISQERLPALILPLKGIVRRSMEKTLSRIERIVTS